MTSTAPIGVFDSGLGGISVVRQIVQDMPHERVLYFGDSANAPYGTKTPQEVRRLSFDIMERFMSQGVKAVVIACNTAAGDGPAPARHMPQHVIVAATPLTLREHKFAALMDRFKANNMISPQPCPDLVEIVESGRLCDHDLVMRTLHRYFDGYDLPSIDSVVLGCTHFVFYRDYFRELLPSTTAIIDGNRGTVRHLGMVLESLGKLAPEEMDGGVEIANSDSGERIAALSRELLHS